MAGFQVDMSPLVNSSMTQARASQSIGQSLGGAIGQIGQAVQRNNQQDAQQGLNDLASRAMGGDVEAFQQLTTQSPQAAQQVAGYLQQQQQGNAASRDNANKDAVRKIHQIQRLPVKDQPKAFAEMVEFEGDDVDQSDIDRLMADPTGASLRELTVEYLGAEESKGSYGYGADGSDMPARVKETEWFNKQTPEVQETHLKVIRGEKPSLDEKLDYEKSKSEIKEDSSIRTARKKSQEERRQGYVDSGVDSADNLKAVNRSIALLDSVKTGGIDNALIRAKQTLGIESADEAELSYELGKSVLKQLKPTFGAAFTVNEMLELKKMESGLGKSVEGNRRILKNLAKVIKRSAERGMRAAKNLGDDFSAEEIMMAMSGGEPEVKVKTTDDLSDEDLAKMYGG
tara:strand:+ start:8948 stop:10144 length:1197 start_codon:yes stop_codon:yes gene_type:complete